MLLCQLNTSPKRKRGKIGRLPRLRFELVLGQTWRSPVRRGAANADFFHPLFEDLKPFHVRRDQESSYLAIGLDNEHEMYNFEIERT